MRVLIIFILAILFSQCAGGEYPNVFTNSPQDSIPVVDELDDEPLFPYEWGELETGEWQYTCTNLENDTVFFITPVLFNEEYVVIGKAEFIKKEGSGWVTPYKFESEGGVDLFVTEDLLKVYWPDGSVDWWAR